MSPESDVDIKVCDFGIAKMAEPEKIVIPDKAFGPQKWSGNA